MDTTANPLPPFLPALNQPQPQGTVRARGPQDAGSPDNDNRRSEFARELRQASGDDAQPSRNTSKTAAASEAPTRASSPVRPGRDRAEANTVAPAATGADAAEGEGDASAAEEGAVGPTDAALSQAVAAGEAAMVVAPTVPTLTPTLELPAVDLVAQAVAPDVLPEGTVLQVKDAAPIEATVTTTAAVQDPRAALADVATATAAQAALGLSVAPATAQVPTQAADTRRDALGRKGPLTDKVNEGDKTPSTSAVSGTPTDAAVTGIPQATPWVSNARGVPGARRAAQDEPLARVAHDALGAKEPAALGALEAHLAHAASVDTTRGAQGGGFSQTMLQVEALQGRATGGLASLAAVSTDATSGKSIEAHLDVALDNPRFAASFGAQISLMARDGIKQAKLQLNPAELGPVMINIAIDGAQARIDFHAHAALTRDAIESSLPSLASALRESGLTLAGGSVYDQPRDAARDARQQAQGGPGQGPGQQGGRGDGDGSDAALSAAGAARVALRPTRGLVDLTA